jgi:hypothetical protein
VLSEPCGKAHFRALAADGAAAEFIVATSLGDVLNKAEEQR